MDAIEKICREHPEWILPYIDRFQSELATCEQPSIQWHLAQIYSEVSLNPAQKFKAINWLKSLLSSADIDWIVSTNAMKTLVQFAKDGSVSQEDAEALIKVQQKHRSKSVVKKANNLLEIIEA